MTTLLETVLFSNMLVIAPEKRTIYKRAAVLQRAYRAMVSISAYVRKLLSSLQHAEELEF